MANPERLPVPDGSVFEDAATGTRITLSGDTFRLYLRSIRSIGIDDLRAVEEHCINRVYNTVSHFIRFTGGGQVRFVIGPTGELLELSGQGVRISLRDGTALHFGPYLARS